MEVDSPLDRMTGMAGWPSLMPWWADVLVVDLWMFEEETGCYLGVEI